MREGFRRVETAVGGLAAVLVPATPAKVGKGSGGVRKPPKAKAKEKEKSRTRASDPVVPNYGLEEEQGDQEMGEDGAEYLEVLSPKE
jgi:hypothetical protein